MVNDIIDQLHESNFKLLKDVDKENYRLFADELVVASFGAGEKIIQLNDESKEVFFIVSGTVNVEMSRSSQASGERIAKLRQGDTVGDFSLVRKGKVTANIISDTDVVAYRICSDKLAEILAQNPEVGMLIYRNLSTILVDRLIDANFITRHTLSRVTQAGIF